MPEKDLKKGILVFGYTGAYCDPATSGYSLGNGYRVYLSEPMSFSAPDGSSSFIHSAVNPYRYGGDDLSGHLNVFAWIGTIGGVAGIGLALSPFAAAAIGSAGTDIAIRTVLTTAKQQLGRFGLAGVMTRLAGILSVGLEDRSTPFLPSLQDSPLVLASPPSRSVWLALFVIFNVLFRYWKGQHNRKAPLTIYEDRLV